MYHSDTITKVKNFRNKALENDLNIVRDMNFTIGVTLVEKIEEVEKYFSGKGAIENLISANDFGDDKNLFTEYGKKIRSYYKNLEQNLKFKLRANILEVTNEFKKHIEIIKEIEATSDNDNLTDTEIAHKHLILIEDNQNISLNLMRNLPFWSELNDLRKNKINGSLPLPTILESSNSSIEEINLINTNLKNSSKSISPTMSVTICPELESIESGDNNSFRLSDNLLSYQGEKLVFNEDNKNCPSDQSTFEINIKSYIEKRDSEIMAKGTNYLLADSQIKSSNNSIVTNQKLGNKLIKGVGIPIRNNTDLNVNRNFIPISNKNRSLSGKNDTLKRPNNSESLALCKKSKYILSDSEDD